MFVGGSLGERKAVGTEQSAAAQTSRLFPKEKGTIVVFDDVN